jgi:phosphatidylinositol alpha-1,6-mannosyltransferase
MKTLLLTFDFPPILGGISTVFYNIWRYLPHKECLVLAPKAGGTQPWDADFQNTVYRRYLPKGNNIFKKLARALLLLVYCFTIIRKEKVRYILCGQPITTGLVGLFFRKVRGIPFQVWVYGGEIVKFGHEKIIFGILLRVLRQADTVIVNSDFTRTVYVRLGIPADKIVKITPAVDTDFFKPGIDTQDLMQRYNLTGQRVILTVARLSERKGHDVVISALSKLKRQIPDITYLIVGTGPDEKRLKKLARDYAVQDRVIFCGSVKDEDLPKFYNLCDIHVMPNREVKGIDTLEGFGLSFIEASACGKPVIGGKSGGSYEAITDGVTGYLINPVDVDELARRIAELLTNKEAACAMGKRGRKRVEEDFQWSERAKTLERILGEQAHD